MKNTQDYRYTELGDFLKTRRNKMKPEQLGLPIGTRRRTLGLRREEVAYLTGIGLTWYTWMEQGRAINISCDALDSLSRVYLLTKDEREHLYELANKTPLKINEEYKPINDTLIRILKQFDISYCPAYIMDQHWNILAWNDLAKVVFTDFSKLSYSEKNIVHMMFCNHEYIKLFEDWEFHAKGVISRFHATMAKYIDDQWFIEFIENLKNKSDKFRAWWSLHDINGMHNVTKKIKTPINR